MSLRFGTVGSPQTTPGTGTVAAIAHSADLGLEHMEIAWTRSVRVGDATCAEIKATARAHKITLSVHAPYFINLNSQTAEKMAASDERLLQAARKGAMAGATDIVFHPGSYHGESPAAVYPRVCASLTRIQGQLHAEGVQVTLRPETMGKSAMFGDLDEVLRLSQDVPDVLPCVDWAHLHARSGGDGAFNGYHAFDRALTAMRDALGEAGMRCLHSHMSGIAYNDRGEREHIPLNEADFDYRALLQALIDHDACGTVGVEAPRPFHTADCLTIQATYQHLQDKSATTED